MLLIAAIGLIVYSNTFGVPFQFDDYQYISDNSYIRDLNNFSTPPERGVLQNDNMRLHFRSRIMGFFSFALNYRLHGTEVTGYHAVNLVIHIINAILVYLVAASLTGSEVTGGGAGSTPRSAALFAGLLFVAHPIQTQAVTYISQRFTSLATLFCLAALACYGAARRTSGLRRGLWYAASFVLCLSAVRTKEIAFTLPFLILLYDLIFFDGPARRRLMYLFPLFSTLAVIPLDMLPAGRSLADLVGEVNSGAGADLPPVVGSYFYTQLRVIVTYLRLLIIPVGQNLDYDYRVSTSLAEPAVLASLALLLGILVGALYLLRHRSGGGAMKIAAFGIIWFFVTLSVESSIIPLADLIFEHRVYLPSAGIFIGMAGAVRALQDHTRWSPRAGLLAGFALIVALGFAAHARNAVWRDHVSLWKDVAGKSPGKARAFNNLGLAYEEAGDPGAAISCYITALTLKPDFAQAHNNLGLVYGREGQIDRSIQHLEVAVRLAPVSPKAHYNLGFAYQSRGMLDKALQHFITAAAQDLYFAEPRFGLGVLYAGWGKDSEAIQQFQAAKALKPGYADAQFNLAVLYLKRGNRDMALQELDSLLAYRPEHAEAKLLRTRILP